MTKLGNYVTDMGETSILCSKTAGGLLGDKTTAPDAHVKGLGSK